MITTASRIGELTEAIEQGEEVDYGRLLRLQALDVARAGEQFVEEALARTEEADAELERIIAGS